MLKIQKILNSIFILSLLIFCFTSQAFAADETAYNSIINSYIDYIDSKGTDVGSLSPEATNFIYFYDEFTDSSSYGYNLYDINQDGVHELLVGLSPTLEEVVTIQGGMVESEVAAIFTLVDGQPKLVCSDYNPDDSEYHSQEIGVLPDNRIKIYGKNKPYKPGSAYSNRLRVCKLNPDGTLTEDECYVEDYPSPEGSPKFYSNVNGQEKEIDLMELDKIMRSDAMFPEVHPLIAFKSHNPIKDNNGVPSKAPGKEIYRLYNRITGEHLYTPDENEASSLTQGDWNDEGVAWRAPSDGDPVYRLYCEATKVHLYTSDINEVNSLEATGIWSVDNGHQPIFFSDGINPVYRLYNEGLKMHLLTTNIDEYNTLGSQGWNQEGIKFYCN